MKLLLIASDPALITNFDALTAGSVRYIGRRLDRELNAFVATGEPEEVNAYAEYVKAVQCGELIAANAETARYCGVGFNQ